MRRYAPVPFMLLAIVLVLPSARANQVIEISAPSDSFEIQQVALFKNGLGFFVAQAKCPVGRKEFQITLPSVPAHGTFWISHAPSVNLVNVVATETYVSERVDAVNIPELLKANVGAKVSLTLGDREVMGVITHMAQERETLAPRPYSAGGRGDNETRPPQLMPPNRARLVTLKTESGTLCLDPEIVTNVTFLETKIQQSFMRPSKAVRLDVTLAQPAAGQTIGATYLAKGLTWSPSYMVDISDERKARVSAKALILNDACELKGVAVQLVTGFPHLQFSDTVSPIAMKENIAQFVQSLTRGPQHGNRYRAMDNIMLQNTAYSGGGMGGCPIMPEYGAAEAGTAAEDLFLYPAGRIDLARDTVAYVPLFTESIPYEHLYQWNIPDYVDAEGRYDFNRSGQPGAEGEQEVWHSLRLTNTTNVPWTTAPAETIKNGMILGQDTLKYTPPAAEGTLRITRAIGLKADQVEFETDRKRDAMQMYGYHYDLVTIRGELSALNTQAKGVMLEITKTLSGQIKSIDPEAKQEKLATGLRRMNGLTKLTWTIDLAPADEQQISYTYEVYVRR